MSRIKVIDSDGEILVKKKPPRRVRKKTTDDPILSTTEISWKKPKKRNQHERHRDLGRDIKEWQRLGGVIENIDIYGKVIKPEGGRP